VTAPRIEIDEEASDKIFAEFQSMMHEAEEAGESLVLPTPIMEEQPRPKRRGRVPYKRNPDGSYERDALGNPIKDYDATSSSPSSSTSVSVRRNPLPAAPLTKREEKQVAERLTNILQGATSTAALFKPYLAMTDDEAKAIAEPLSSYLIRMEPTSKVAKQILDEYDLVAVIFAVMAYGVRVVMDFQKEREAIKNVTPNQQPIESRRPSVTRSDDVGSSNASDENTSGETRYAGPISTPAIEGNGVLPRL
jgi:hypothetical protein